MKFNTSLLHSGVNKNEVNGATLSPIYQCSAFHHSTAEELGKIFDQKAPGYSYTRVSNPTVTAFENRITALEGGISSIAFSSGMAALANAFLNILRSGDEIVTSASLYGGTIDLFKDIESFGITTRYVENNNWEQFEAAINDRTRLIFAETLGNPRLDVTDIAALAELAHAHGLPLIIDNTVATAYLVQPLKRGADIVVNSSSKYINGSSNSISGVLTDGGKFKWDFDRYPDLKEYKKYGPFAYTTRLRARLLQHLGACLAPQNAYLNQIGLETLGLRMQRQCDNTLALARFLEDNFAELGVTVNYPGLEHSPWHEIAKNQFRNGYGACLTLRVGSREKAFGLINSLQLVYKLSNIGDVRTLVVHPASTISLHSTDKQREEAGVFDDQIRVCVGIEDIEDLQEDFAQAIKLIQDL